MKNEKGYKIADLKIIIENTSLEHPYKDPSDRDTYSQYNEGWADACDILGHRILDYLKK